MDRPLLEVDDLHVHFGTPRGPVKAVDGVSLTLRPGERLGLIGESGSGKSTIALAAMRLVKPPGKVVGGRILLDGTNLLDLSEEEMRRRRMSEIALVTQGAMNSLNPVIRIRHQLLDGLRAHGIRLSGDRAERRIADLLRSVDLDPGVADVYPHQLSGGMKQRVCIATAISLQPKVIIADEPTSALDVIVQQRVMMTLRRVQDELGAAIILIGHDMGLMAQFAQRVAVMRAGKLVEVDDVEEIFARPKHPYTRLLLDSLPSFDQRNDLLAETSPPDAATPLADGGAGPPLLELRNVSLTYGGGLFRRRPDPALRDFSLVIEDQQPTIVAVVGESGSGKTTMARLVLGLETPTSGEVLYRGKDLRRFSRGERRAFRREAQAIFQDPFGVYNSFYKVDHVLTTPVAKFKLATSREDARRLIDAALRAVGLRPEDTLGRYPHQLSGGQRQRTMVARTLLLRPKVIVTDEPVSMVDASLRVTVLGNLLQLKQDHGISLIYITHDLATAYQISDRIIVLHRGVVVESGDPEQIVKRPQHPYTKQLIDSVPLPDPSRPWGAGPPESDIPLTA